ncbi:MAG: hypothetical protein ACRC3Y_15985 [Romboutsia sp.]|uniref:hypothetical protein n=1 Tax=Romboutsia sp. TaxID=1965302 RepID=UPI003F323FAC
MSSFICCLLTFLLIIVNGFMGIFIGLDIYMIIFAVLTIGLTIGLVMFNYKKIFYKKRKIQKSKPSISTSSLKNNQKETIKTKRKIS